MMRLAILIAVFAFSHTYIEKEAFAAEVLVSAATSLKDVLSEIGRAYETKSKTVVQFNFGSSSELERQIEAGAPADVFFSADSEKIDMLDRKGLIDRATRRNLLSNALVLIAPIDSRSTLHAPRDLLKPEVRRIALAQPDSVPAGIYAKKYLEVEGLWSGVASKVIPVLDVRATLAAVESGNVDAGFVYKTDAAISNNVRTVYEVPPGKGPKIVYPIAVLRNSKVKTAAVAFVTYVSSSAVAAVFKKYGFIVLD
jgi:molybdate transport system substrate-binding protein